MIFASGNLFLINGAQYDKAGSSIITHAGLKSQLMFWANFSASADGLYFE
jgi:hypothetical protein